MEDTVSAWVWNKSSPTRILLVLTVTRCIRKEQSMRATPEKVEEILSHPTCTVEEAASVLGVGRGHAYPAVKAGEIPAIRLGTRMLVKTAALRRMTSNGVDARHDPVRPTTPGHCESHGPSSLAAPRPRTGREVLQDSDPGLAFRLAVELMEMAHALQRAGVLKIERAAQTSL